MKTGEESKKRKKRASGSEVKIGTKIPEPLWKTMRIFGVMSGLSLNDIIREALIEFLKENKNDPLKFKDREDEAKA